MSAGKIPLEPITSTNIASAGYDAERSILAICFTSGSIYHYAGVTLAQATAFYTAASKGRHFNQFIKGQFSGAKLTGRCPACGDKHGWIGDLCVSCGDATYRDGGQ